MKQKKRKNRYKKIPIYLSFFIFIGKLPTKLIVFFTLFIVHGFKYIRKIASTLKTFHVAIRFPKFRTSFTISFPKIHTPSIQMPSLKIRKITIKKISVQPPHFRFPRLKIPLLFTFVFLFLCSSVTVFFYMFVIKDLPKPSELSSRKPIVSTKIYDRNGNLLYTIFKDENRTLIPLSSVPEYARQATIAIEDKDFYKHKGLSLRGMLRAFKRNLGSEHLQGGSTITQQLIKNTLLSPEKTVRRKLREVILAVQTELTFSKDAILEMYLNEVSYGGSLYGIEEASQSYFGKSANKLTLSEAALLAGLPQAPSLYSPFGPYPEQSIIRQHEVLNRMVEDGYITKEQAELAKEEKLSFMQNRTQITAPHFVMYVREQLAKMFGENMVSQGGLEVYTSLDLDTQKLSEKAIITELEKLKKLHVTNGAVVVTNPKSGEIYAMVGSKDYFDVQNDGQVNVALMQRQPGSSIKALTYAVALEHGFTPSTIIEDAPITYKNFGSEPYSPQNYDGKFHGKVPLRVALASSYNVPAVKTLSTVGLQNVIEKGRSMGITTWDESNAKRFGLSLTLGGGEVLMVDMAKVYGTFANNGTTVNLNPILSVKNYKGETLYLNPCQQTQTPCNGTRTLDPKVSYQITNILSDNVARSPAFGINSVLNIPNQQVAVKTGTTNSLRDNWTIGYTNDKVVVSWVGNNDNTPMSYVASGITGASPIWRNIMNGLLQDNNPSVFVEPSGLKKVTICAATGTLPCDGCPKTKVEYFIPGTEPKTSCKTEFFTQQEDGQKPISM